MHFQVAPDLYVFAINLRCVVENDNPIKQGTMFAIGRGHGLKVSTLAGMSNRSESHVRRMLLLIKLPIPYVIAVADGASYSPLLRALKSGEPLPEVPWPDRILSPIGI